MLKIAILMWLVFIGPATASLTWTNDSVLALSDVSRDAGEWATMADYSKMLYQDKAMTYETYRDVILTANRMISRYNYFLKSGFNESTYIQKRMAEYTI